MEKQLAELMEMGFHAELALPYCDGISTVDEIVDKLCLEGDEVGSRTTDAVVAAAAAAAPTLTPRAPQRMPHASSLTYGFNTIWGSLYRYMKIPGAGSDLLRSV